MEKIFFSKDDQASSGQAISQKNELESTSKDSFIKTSFIEIQNIKSNKELEQFFNPSDESIDKYTDEYVTNLLEKYFLSFDKEKTSPNGAYKSEMPFHFVTTPLFNKLQNKNPKDFNERFFSIFSNLANKYPEQASRVWDIVHQFFGEYCDPKVFIPSVAHIISNPYSRKFFIDRISSDLTYNLAYTTNPQDIEKVLDFKDVTSYRQVAEILNLLGSTFWVGQQDWSKSNGVPEKIHKILKSAVENKEGSYFLNIHARKLLNFIENGESPYSVDEKPFEVSPGVYGYDSESLLFSYDEADKESGFYISQPKDSKYISDLLSDYKNEELLPDDELINLDDDSRIDLARKTINKDQEKEEQINSKFKLIQPSDLFLVGVDEKSFHSDFMDWRFLMEKQNREMIKQELGLDITKITIPEQFRFLNYIKNVEAKNISSTSKFIKDFGVTGLKTFLSIEHGGQDMGDKILSLGEKLPKEVSEKVFAKYSEIVDSANEATDFVARKLSGVDSEQYISHIQDNLLRKGKDLLSQSAEKIATCAENECVEIGNSITEEIAHIKREILLFASTFKVLSNTEGMKLADIKDTTIEVTNDKSIIQKYKTEMERIFTDNRKTYPEKLKQKSLSEFNQVLNHPEQSEFYILKNVDDVVAFMRFDKLPNGNIYAGSLNSRNEIHGLAVGGALLKEVLDEKAKTNDIEAVVYSENPMLKKYTSEYKFEIAEEIPDYKGTGELFYKIIRKKE